MRYLVFFLLRCVFIASLLLALAVFLAPALDSALSAIATIESHSSSTFSPAETAVIVLGYKLYQDGALWPPLRLRVSSAASILDDGKAHTILFTGGIPPEWSAELSEAYAMRRYMKQCHPKVLKKPHHVILEERSGSTQDNALQSLDLLLQKVPHVRHLILATNQFHQFRALRVFSRASAGRVAISIAPAPPTMCADRMQTACATECLTSSPSAIDSHQSAIVSASSVRSQHLAHRPHLVFDDSIFSYWHSANGMPQWFEYDFGDSDAHVCGYALRARADACCVAADSPSDWEFWGTSRTQNQLLHSVSAAISWTSSQQRVYLLETKAFVGKVRWFFQRVGGRSSGQNFVVLSEMAVLKDCSNAPVLNESARVDVFAPALLNDEKSKLEVEGWIALAKALTPWTWRAELTWEVARELLAILYYYVQGWI